MEVPKKPLNSLSGQLAPAAAGWLWQNAAPCGSERENKEWDKLALSFPHCLWAVSVEAPTHASWWCHLLWVATEDMGWWRADAFWEMGTYTHDTEKWCLKNLTFTHHQAKQRNPNKHAQYYLKKIEYHNKGFWYSCNAAVEVGSVSLHHKMVHKSKLVYANRNRVVGAVTKACCTWKFYFLHIHHSNQFIAFEKNTVVVGTS